MLTQLVQSVIDMDNIQTTLPSAVNPLYASAFQGPEDSVVNACNCRACVLLLNTIYLSLLK